MSELEVAPGFLLADSPKDEHGFLGLKQEIRRFFDERARDVDLARLVDICRKSE